MSRKPTASIQAWLRRAMASKGLLSCGLGSFGRLWYIYSERFLALKTLPPLMDIVAICCKAQMIPKGILWLYEFQKQVGEG